MLRRHKPGLTPDAVAKGMVSKAAQVFSVQDASYGTNVFAQAHHSFLRRTLRCSRSKLMLCPPCMQAIFSIKPMQFPQATRKLGDNYIEGFTDDKPVKKFFADKYELLCADTKFCPCYNALFVYEHGCLTRACGQTG